MKSFYERTEAEKAIIRNAYAFEAEAIEAGSNEPNPYAEAVKAMGLWEAINEALELHYRGV